MWRAALRIDRAATEGKPSECDALVQAVATGRSLCSARCGARWPQTEVTAFATAAGGQGAAARRTGSRFRHGPVDAAARRQDHRPIDWSALSPRSHLEGSGSHGLEFTATGQAGSRARRQKGETLVGATVAGSKKNARRRKARIFFPDESGVSQRPPVRRSWAPKGETPILIHAFNWQKMSICAALG